MNCEYFGKCASCTLYDKSYEEQLDFKIQREKERFSNFTTMNFDIIKSSEKAFRNRAEFRIWWENDENGNHTISYAMNDFNKNILEIDSCQIVSPHIQEVMPKLLELITKEKELEEATALELPMMTENLPIIATITTLGTLFGLLGTVIGMIRSFAALSAGGGADSMALSQGISEALINTAFGILTGALAVISYNYYTNKIDKLTYGLDEVGFSIVQTFAATH